MEDKRYIYLGNELNLPDFRFSKGGIYYGDTIEELREKYPLLKKILIDTEELPKFNQNEILLNSITEELKTEIERGEN